MRRIVMGAFALANVGLLGVASCGGGPSPGPVHAQVVPTASATSAPTATATTSEEPSEAVDLSAVPQPDTIVATVRLSHPHETLARLQAIVRSAGLPVPSLETMMLTVLELDGARDTLAFDAPIDVAFMAGGGSRNEGIAMSIGVRSADAFVSSVRGAYTVQPGDKGMMRLSPKRGGFSPFGGGKQECALGLAFQPTAEAPKTRLVCAMSRAGVSAIAPYMLRTLPRQAMPSDLHLELSRTAIERLVSERDDDDLPPPVTPPSPPGGPGDVPVPPPPPSSPHGRGGSRAFFRQMFEQVLTTDLDTLVADGTLNDAGLDATFKLKLRAQQSPITRALVGAPDRAGPVPDSFWRAPADSDFIAYTRGIPAADFGPLRDAVLDAGKRDCVGAGRPADACQQISDAVRALIATEHPIAIARGVDAAAAKAALATLEQTDNDKNRVAALAAVKGWTLVAVDEPIAKLDKPVRDLVAAETRAHARQTGGTKKIDAVITPAPGALGLPAQTLHVELRTTYTPIPPPPNPPPQPGGRRFPPPQVDRYSIRVPTTTHVFVVPDGDRTWFAIGEDAAATAQRAKVAMGRSPSGTVSGSPDLRAFTDARATTMGMMFTIPFFAAFSVDGDYLPGLQEFSSTLAQLDSLPDKGRTPVPLIISRSPGSPDEVTATLSVPRVVLADTAKSMRP